MSMLQEYWKIKKFIVPKKATKILKNHNFWKIVKTIKNSSVMWKKINCRLKENNKKSTKILILTKVNLS